MQQALQAIENLRAVVDTLIIVSNDRWATRKSLDCFDCDVCDPYQMQTVRDHCQAKRAIRVLINGIRAGSAG